MKTAGDLLIDAIAACMRHVPDCSIETCPTCAVLINRQRLAFKVWENSAHKASSSAETTLLKWIVIGWDADQDDEFTEGMRAARELLGLKLADDADRILTQLQIQHADDADAEDDDAEDLDA